VHRDEDLTAERESVAVGIPGGHRRGHVERDRFIVDVIERPLEPERVLAGDRIDLEVEDLDAVRLGDQHVVGADAVAQRHAAGRECEQLGCEACGLDDEAAGLVGAERDQRLEIAGVTRVVGAAVAIEVRGRAESGAGRQLVLGDGLVVHQAGRFWRVVVDRDGEAALR
jgi:hypothetical protein